MGGNGTASVLGYVENKQYRSLGTFSDPIFGEIEIVEWTATGSNKSPEESNSAPRIYATFDKNGKGVNEIAKYGADHKKEWAIHTVPHNSKEARKKGEAVPAPHYHEWSNGHPEKPKAFNFNDSRIGLLQRLTNFYKTKK